MSTRRELTATLIGLPAIASAFPDSSMINPFSEEAARIISYTIYAEARGEPFKGKMAVAAVIQTRARNRNRPLADICTREKQFSCWNELKAVPDFYSKGTTMQPADLKARSDCYGIAWALMTSERKWDYLTHFYNPELVTPAWAGALQGIRTIGKHTFGYID